MKLNISKKDGTNFTEGEEYKLAVKGNVKKSDGTLTALDYSGYFATNYSFSFSTEGIKALDGERSLIVCISDIHLGADLEYSEFNKNMTALADFLDKVRLAPNVKELVIAGDLIDEWFVPAYVNTYDGKTQVEFAEKLAAANKPVIDGFNKIITEGKIKVTYVPGNHDILLVSESLQKIMPGISEARDTGLKGLGTYSPADHQEIAFEHGHRYNYFCAPDPISNRSITNTESILPPGYFFTRLAATSVHEKKPAPGYDMPVVTQNSLGESQDLLYYYFQVLKGILKDLPIKEGFDEKIIVTNIDGFTASYSMSDIFPFQETASGPIDVVLYKGAQDNWDKRQEANLVPVKIKVQDAILKAADSKDLDGQSDTQYFKNTNSSKRIVVFGHSHVALVKESSNAKSQKCIYANSGTWIDHNPAGTKMNFVVISPPKASGAAPEFVNVYTYSDAGEITRLDNPQAITGLNK
ncbi:MAG: metallophosphoesterase [Candidatus Riflebacteria bacterium]|nr:metallophosphoesterase [Candidatus Riflebacteria bacterium]